MRSSSGVVKGCFTTKALRMIGTLSNEAIPDLSSAPISDAKLFEKK